MDGALLKKCHATCSGEHQRSERGLFHLHNSACVYTFLHVFMLAIYLLRGEVLVRFRIWVTHPYVKECGTLSRPKTSCMNVKPGIRGCISPPWLTTDR